MREQLSASDPNNIGNAEGHPIRLRSGWSVSMILDHINKKINK